MKGLYVMHEDVTDQSVQAVTRRKIAVLLGSEPQQVSGEFLQEHPETLQGVEILITSYGACRLDEKLMAHADSLKAVFHAGGTIRGLVSAAFWRKKIPIVSAACENAIPVAEFAFAEIILCLKRFFYHVNLYRDEHIYDQREMPGAYGAEVGIVSYGEIAKLLCRMILNHTDLKVHIYSPELDRDSAAKLGLIYTPLDEIFRKCDVVSLHTPHLPQTEKMIREDHFLSMKQNASFINTARGQVVDEAGMISALKRRPDITALLDVTAEEPLGKDSPLFGMKNVVVSPHLAGAYYREKNRLGELVFRELERFLNGEPLRHNVTEERLKTLA